MFSQNPFNNQKAIDNSNYNVFLNNKLKNFSNGQHVCPRTEIVHAEFRSFVLDKDFSCILGKAAMKKNAYRFGLYQDWNSDSAIAGISRDLYQFLIDPIEGDYTTFVASFSCSIDSEEEFELGMWSFLERLSDVDQEYHSHDTRVSSNPEDNDYSYSFGESAFFLIGMHPKSSRITRQFAHPTIIFNLHSQFRSLKKSEKFIKYQSIIRKREIKLQGNINPNLANFGEKSEARQYSGRRVKNDWICPYSLE